MSQHIDGRTNGRSLGPPKSLRELRLWHWRKVTLHRAAAHRIEQENLAFARRNKKIGAETAKFIENAQSRAQHRVANWHLSAVQVLNEHFEIGDTAEKDDGN